MSAGAWRARSRSSRTTTRARSSRSRERRPGSAASCATSSRSARVRSRCSTRCASASRTAESGTRTRYLLDGAVAGIGHYGNSIGVPTIGGEVYFEGPYEQNCLVNAMALGLADRERLVRARPPARATCSCCSAPRPGATGSAVPRCWPRPSSRRGHGGREPRTSARRCRSAIRSRRRSCWSARWSCSSVTCSSRCRTSAPPA